MCHTVGMNIAESVGYIKAWLDRGVGEWGLFAVFILIGLASFGLGRFSAFEEVRPPVSLAQAPQTPSPAALYIGGLVVASRSGSVYYYPWCSGGQKISAQDQRWFADEAAAEAAGYTPAKSCKGLGQ